MCQLFKIGVLEAYLTATIFHAPSLDISASCSGWITFQVQKDSNKNVT
jgi:hypothetical protein